ncbi:hypothetical protein JKP75_03640 [Blastococcus sp. TML/M2B]|uniref:hypothetical protein n=1 Tax=unclassified Blastococcus TaxID=2619396 RepID=UPI00190B9B18|nr:MULTISPECIES: hypothetical protein [unclassified Blastococcus]MBN1091742.1 hypothetical protein [Blastococcus sp. TML/M2B]MBN1094699.1 hypothetical protein [Blastococcus sp. TML/C7B]
MADATTTAAPARRAHPAHSALVGLTTLGVLLQGLWAGLFLGGTDDPGTWYDVHKHGAEATVALAALATVAAFVWLRHRTPVVVATALLFVLLVVEMLLGLADSSAAVAVHVPLAMLIMGLAVWLPVQARRG